MLLSLLCQLTRVLLGAPTVICRREVAKAAELLVLRHENAVLRRRITRVRYTPTDRIWLPAVARLIPRHRWREIFTVTPGHRARLAPPLGDPHTGLARPTQARPSTDPGTDQDPHRAHGPGQLRLGHRRIQGELIGTVALSDRE